MRSVNGAVVWLPTIADTLSIGVAAICYFAPGALIGDILFDNDNIAYRLSIGISIIICYYMTIGFILASFVMLIHLNIFFIWICTFSLSLITWFYVKRKTLRDRFHFKAKQFRFVLFITMSIVFLFILYFVWEGKSEGISAWDRSEHLVKLHYLITHAHLPESEIGMMVNAFGRIRRE